ncbi:MarR family EPS-associated transcriptional regulator [Rhodobacterales bacterium LSUCC0387]|nr:MarR family EPS-associated transcriptional regulator [Rhodobacterales bacterium LSUCC0387]
MASTRDFRALRNTFQSMRLIHQEAGISTRKLAERLQISNGAAYYVLKSLIEKGYVKAENFSNSNNKLGYSYFLTPTGLREKSALASQFIALKRKEYNTLRAELESLEREFERSASVTKKCLAPEA